MKERLENLNPFRRGKLHGLGLGVGLKVAFKNRAYSALLKEARSDEAIQSLKPKYGQPATVEKIVELQEIFGRKSDSNEDVSLRH